MKQSIYLYTCLLISVLSIAISVVNGDRRSTPTMVWGNTTIIVSDRYYVNVPLKFFPKNPPRDLIWPLWLIITVALICLGIVAALISLFFFIRNRRRRNAAKARPESSIMMSGASKSVNPMSSFRDSISKRSALSRTSRPQRLSSNLGVSSFSKSTSAKRGSSRKPSTMIGTAASSTRMPRGSSMTKVSTSGYKR